MKILKKVLLHAKKNKLLIKKFKIPKKLKKTI